MDLSVRILIRSLLDIDVQTDDLAVLRRNPELFVADPVQTEKIRDLLLLLDLANGEEDAHGG
mgnify:CR=1 FL=1